MNYSNKKVINIETAIEKVRDLKAKKKKIVLCYGHFNVIHPGHLRFLSFAKSQGDYLIAAVKKNEATTSNDGRRFFPQEDRAYALATVDIVDLVLPLDDSVEVAIKKIVPDFYVKGKEFASRIDSIKSEIDAVETVGGKVLFSSGDVFFENSILSNLNSQKPKHQEFLNVCRRQKIDYNKLLNSVDQFSQKNFLVLGEIIVDQFVACDSLGISAEAPVQVIRELETKEFLGGAGIVALNLQSLGAKTHFLSIAGADSAKDFAIEKLNAANVNHSIIVDPTRPTTFKIRYMVNNHKILRVSRIKQHPIDKEIEDRILSKIDQLLPQVQGIIISDFVYGLMTERLSSEVVKRANLKGVQIFADVQASTQLGKITKYKNITLAKPTEKELRFALEDMNSGLEDLAQQMYKKTNNDNLLLTLGENGHITFYKSEELKDVYKSEYFPSLVTNPIDVAGAGDAMLVGTSLGMTCGLNLMEASVLGACMSAITIMRVGNVPISPVELRHYLSDLFHA